VSLSEIQAPSPEDARPQLAWIARVTTTTPAAIPDLLAAKALPARAGVGGARPARHSPGSRSGESHPELRRSGRRGAVSREDRRVAGGGAVKSNPIRRSGRVAHGGRLQDGKSLNGMPRLAESHPFFPLDPERWRRPRRPARSRARRAGGGARTVDVDGSTRQTCVKGAWRRRVGRAASQGRRVQRPRVLALAGSRGCRRAHGRRHNVHERQMLAAGVCRERARHSRRCDRHPRAAVVRCPRSARWQLPDVRWDELTDDKIAAIPLLGRVCGLHGSLGQRPRRRARPIHALSGPRGVERATTRSWPAGAEANAHRPRLRHHDALSLEELDARVST